jgi:thiamine pyrophosphate-dependent acetolactate synthase large subunit-like protein
MDELDAAVREALAVDRPAVIDAVVDPAEYDLQQGPSRPAPAVSDAAP